METILKGIVAPLLVPCGKDGQTDEKLFEKHIRFLEKSGVHGVFVGGTTGEFVNYTLEERNRQLEIALDATDRMSVLYNITSTNQREMEKYIQFAQAHGVTAVSVTAPYFHKYDRASLVDFFALVSEMTDGLDLFIYNMPGMTGNALTSDMVEELCDKCSNLKGIKDSSMNFTNLEEMLAVTPEDFELVTGNDAEILASFKFGCKGAIVATANVYPEICVQIYSDFLRGEYAKAWEYQKEIVNIRKVCRSVMPIMSHKYLLELRGMEMGCAHFPFRELSENEKEKLKMAARTAQECLKGIERRKTALQ